MTEQELNINYICKKTLLDKNDKLVPIILEMISESYKAGLCQAEYDNTMGLVEENNALLTLINWAEECGFGFDNFKDNDYVNWEEFEKESKDMDYIKSMIYYAKKYNEMSKE